jgi:hypothetical protein
MTFVLHCHHQRMATLLAMRVASCGTSEEEAKDSHRNEIALMEMEVVRVSDGEKSMLIAMTI